MSPKERLIDEEDTYQNQDEINIDTLNFSDSEDGEDESEMPHLIPIPEIIRMIEAESHPSRHNTVVNNTELDNNDNNSHNNTTINHYIDDNFHLANNDNILHDDDSEHHDATKTTHGHNNEFNNNNHSNKNINNNNTIEYTANNDTDTEQPREPNQAIQRGIQQGNHHSPIDFMEGRTSLYQRIQKTNQNLKLNPITDYYSSAHQQIRDITKKLIHLENPPIPPPNQKLRKQRNKRHPTRHLQRPPLHTSSWQQTKIDTMNDDIHTQQKDKQMLEPWGDPLRLQPNWPIENDNKTLRIATVNINGINPNNNYLELEAIIGQMLEYQIDVLCLTELNLDIYNRTVYNDVWEAVKKYDRHFDILMKTSKSNPRTNNSSYKPGGTMILTNSAWSGRRIRDFDEPCSNDQLGRWTTLHLRCKAGRKISIINWYRVNDDKHNLSAINTIYMQQSNDLAKLYHRELDPRKTITKDVEQYMRDLIKLGHEVLLVGDTNEHLQIQQNTFATMIDNLHMKNIMISRHPTTTLPSTYDRGDNCIDAAAGTNGILQTVQATGFLPFYEPFSTDHRVGYVDLNCIQLFGKVPKDTTKDIFHGFHTKNVKKCDEYIKELEEQCETHRIFQKVHELRNRTIDYRQDEKEAINPNHLPLRKAKLINDIKHLEKIRSDLMIGAEAKCRRRKYKQKFAYSGKLVEAAQLLWTTKTLLRRINLGNLPCTEADKLEANKLQKNALRNLRIAQQSSYQLREEMLIELADKYCQIWNIDHGSALKIIKNAEASTKLFERVSRAMKPARKGNIQYVLTPKVENPDESNDLHWNIVEDQTALNQAIIHQNSQHLLKSSTSITATGNLQQQIGWYAEKEDGVQQLLQGSNNKSRQDDDLELNHFIQSLQHPLLTDDDGLEMEWTFGVKEYKQLFGRTREGTACGPSGLHMSHWKAAIEREELTKVHTFFIWAAFALGFTYDRWQVSWHCMLQKRRKPFIHRLRIIQLYEGDFNGGLKYLLGRRLMKHMVDKKLVPPDTYGSIPGRNAIEAMKLLQLFYENHRLLKRDMAIIFNDADGCYDRIRPNMADITMRRLGLPQSIANVHTQAQVNMKHHVKTANGISAESLQWAPTPPHSTTTIISNTTTIQHTTGNIGGIGQGGGGGPVGWLTLLIVLLASYKELATYATIEDPLELLTFSLYVLSYVDDNSLLTSLDRNWDMTKILPLVESNLLHWRNLLRLTGGDLSIEKCTFSLLKWNHKLQALHTKETMPGTITINNTKLRRIETNTAERQLGIRVPIDGSFHDEYEYRVQRSLDLGRRIKNSCLTPTEAHVAYSVYYQPMIEYPLSITTFTDKQCDTIHRQFIFRCLPKMGMNCHMPRAVVFGPLRYGGRNIFDLKVKQLHHHLRSTKGHMRRHDHVGQAIKANINALQLISGSSSNILLQNPAHFPHVQSNTSIEFLWRKSFELNFSIHYEITLPEPLFSNDITLMEYMRTLDKYTTIQAQSINICRLYYRIVFLGDMCEPQGRTIKRVYLQHGHIQSIRDTPTQFPCPEKWQWQHWIKFILNNFVNGDLSLAINIGHPILPPAIQPTILIHPPPTHIVDGYQHFLGNHPQLQDNGSTLINAIMDNSLQGASDGSWLEKEGQGTWGYALAPTLATTYLGSGNCLLHDATNAQTAEHYGALGILTFLLLLSRHKSLQPNDFLGKYVIIWIDNSEVQRRFNVKPASLKVGTFVLADMELWHTIHAIKALLPFTVVSRWVKGHQDRHTQFDELDFNAQLNVLADKAAEDQYLTNDHFRETPHLHDGGVIYFRDSRGREITQTYSFLQQAYHGNKLRDYIQKKNQWAEGTMNTIDWDNLEQALHAVTPIELTHRTKMIHGWQNTGTQKKMILDSKRDVDIFDPDPAEVQLCPMCKQIEDQLHYTRCTDKLMITTREQELTRLQQKLRNIHTYGEITSLWSKSANQDPTTITLTATNTIELIIQKAFQDQQEIGWHNLLRGHLSREWNNAQEAYIRQQGMDSNIQWASKAIGLLQDYTLTLWNHRNRYLHGIDKRENKILQHTKLQAKVNELFASFDRIHLPINDRTFKMKLHLRLQCSHSCLVNWIELATRRLNLHREEATKNTLDHWLIDKQTPTPGRQE